MEFVLRQGSDFGNRIEIQRVAASVEVPMAPDTGVGRNTPCLRVLWVKGPIGIVPNNYNRQIRLIIDEKNSSSSQSLRGNAGDYRIERATVSTLVVSLAAFCPRPDAAAMQTVIAIATRAIERSWTNYERFRKDAGVCCKRAAWFHTHRTSGSHCDHCHPGRPALARSGPRQAKGDPGRLHVEPQTDRTRAANVSGRQHRFPARPLFQRRTRQLRQEFRH